MKKRGKRWPGIVLLIIVVLMAALFLGILNYTGMIPSRYLAGAGIVLLIFIVIVASLVWNTANIIRFCIGIVLVVVLIGLMGVGSYYVWKTRTALSDISDVSTESAQVDIYVENDNDASNVQELEGETFGILGELDRANTDAVINQLDGELGTELEVKEYPGLTQLIDALLSGEVKAVLLNQAYLGLFEEVPGYEDVISKIRSVGTESVESVISPRSSANQGTEDGTEESADMQRVSTLQQQEESSVIQVYISGIDTRDKSMIARSRSDVNILATINTDTRQILLVNTPRDFFVPLSISGGIPDKLTHAGIYGVDVSMDTLGMLYDTELDYYFRVNFTGFVDIIDALGGIDVYSDYDFTSMGNESGNTFTFTKGMNRVNGEAALAFSRERYSFNEGDRQRGRNQMAVISAVIDKALTPSMLMNYTSVMNSVAGSFETNISYDTIADLVKQQLNGGGSWNVVSYSVDGTGDTQKPFSMSVPAYVMVPDQTTVDKAKELMQQVKDGEEIHLDSGEPASAEQE